MRYLVIAHEDAYDHAYVSITEIVGQNIIVRGMRRFAMLSTDLTPKQRTEVHRLPSVIRTERDRHRYRPSEIRGSSGL